jgi:tRNA (guanine37-N1)-methyltransferase
VTLYFQSENSDANLFHGLPLQTSVSGRIFSIHKKDGETAHQVLANSGWLDLARKPKVVGNRLMLPVLPDTPEGIDLGVYYEALDADLEFREFRPSALKDAPGLPPEVASEVTRSMDVVGTIAILRLKEELRPRANQIGQALMFVQPRLRAVAIDEGVKGELRVRDLTLVAGEGPMITIHKEYGLGLKVDLENAYFSPRLATEHHRVAELVKKGEHLLDMFTGVGPFAIMAAKTGRTREVHAIDLNERAVELAKENAERNGVGHLINIHQGDAREVVQELGRFHRVVMNHPTAAKDFLDVAMSATRDGGVIHLHTIGTPEEVDAVAEEAFEVAERTGHAGVRLANTKEVRTYAPNVAHYCLDLVVIG